MNSGTIVKIVSNLFTIEDDITKKRIPCRARGKFRNDKIIPLVGDKVEYSLEDKYILSIKDRTCELSRPMIANVDYAIIVTTCKRPDFSSFLLDKMIVNVTLNNIEPIICFSKYDLLNESEKENINNYIDYYNSIGIKALINRDIDKLLSTIENKIIVLTGQTGSGKSTLLNSINPELNLKTDDISNALNRGKHTTRHVELYELGKNYIADTPGFSALDVIKDENIRFAFNEFDNNGCKFRDCKHINEKDCAVKMQVLNNEILESRYNNYIKMINE